jgi:hypothetical protein
MMYITDVPCECRKCGWKGTVGDCYPDDDGDLTCPKCPNVVEVQYKEDNDE